MPRKDRQSNGTLGDRNPFEDRVSELGNQVAKLSTKGSLKAHWWNSPLLSGVLSGLTILAVQAFFNHKREDLKRDMRIEVIEQLKPTTEEVSKLSESLAGVKAQLDLVLRGQLNNALKGVLNAPTEQFRKDLPEIAQTLKKAQENKVVADFQLLNALQKRIAARLLLDDRDVWTAAVETVNYDSFLRENKGLVPNAQAVRAATCRLPATGGPDIVYSQVIVQGCTIVLDEQTLVNSYLKDCLVIYRGGPIKVYGTTFENCLFELDLRNGRLTHEAKPLTEAILNAAGERPVVQIRPAA